MSRMFKTVSRTWNIFKGCRFECTYCNARKMAETRLKNTPRYRDGFVPGFVKEDLRRQFKPGDFVFVAYMGDIAWAWRDWVMAILARIELFPQTRFMFMSKNSGCYLSWIGELPPNVYLGTTLESNRSYGVTRAPSPLTRYLDLWNVKWPHKFVSVEPLMDFDLTTLARWIGHIQPEIVEVGADNYHNNLPEPPWWKVEALLGALKQLVPQVVEKDGLERLKGGNH